MTRVQRDELLSDDRYLIHPLHHPEDHVDPVIYVRGEGAEVFDLEGRSYIDGLSSLWNVHIGHGRAELAAVAAEQIKTLAYFSCYSGATHIPGIQLAKKLAGLAPGALNHTFFTTGGAESNDSAFKTARYYWQAKNRRAKTKIISRRHAYHGVTIGAMNATGIESYASRFESVLPHFLHVDAPYPYRFRPGADGAGCGETAARALEEAIHREGPETVAAFIGEPVLGAGGVIVPPDDYWPRVREICTKHDVLLIADEVITGFGRIGHWFGLSAWNVEPDIVSFAKGITSGYMPLGGIIVSEAIYETICAAPSNAKWNHSFTYSAHPVCCMVALKNLELIEQEGLIERGMKMGERLRAGLARLGDMACVGEVRGMGLMAAVELVSDRASHASFDASAKVGTRVVREMLRQGVYTRCRGDVINFAPPFVVSETQIDRMVDVAGDAIRRTVGG